MGTLQAFEWFSPVLKKKNRKACKSNANMDMDVYHKLIKELSSLGTKTILLGDLEPFMDPKLIEKIEYAKQHNLGVIIITNGSFLTEKNVEQLVNLELDYLNVSINAATPQKYPQIHVTETEETFERIVSMVSLLEKIKKEKGVSFPRTRLSMVVCNRNYQEIIKFVELCHKTGVKNAHIKQLIAPSKKEILQELALTPTQQTEMEQHILDALKVGKKLGITVDIESKEDFHQQKTEDLPCYYGWLFSLIDEDGNVYACCFQNYNPIFSFGNINKDSFGKIWLSKKYQKFRSEHKNINTRRKMGYHCNQPACIFTNKQVSNILRRPYLLPFRSIT